MTAKTKTDIKTEITGSSANTLLGGTILTDIVDSYTDNFSTVLPGLTINPTPASLKQGLVINQTPSGTGLPPNLVSSGASVSAWNGIGINSDDSSSTSAGNADFGVVHKFGGTNAAGGRNGIISWVIQTAATATTNTQRNYVGFFSIGETRSGDGGTNTDGGAQGAIFGGNFQTRLNGANMLNSCGLEIDSQGTSTGTTKYNFGVSLVDGNINRGASWDTAIGVYGIAAQSLNGGTFGPGSGWNQILSIGEVVGSGINPTSRSTTIIGTHLESLSTIPAATGVDFTKIVFTGNAWQSNNHFIAQNGNLSIGPNTIGDAIPLSVVNQANAANVSAVTGTVNNMHIAGADGGNNQNVFDSFGGVNTFICRRADGTAASRTGLVANDSICNFQGVGWTSAGAYSANMGGFALRAAETIGSTNIGSLAAIRTVPIGSTTVADALTVDGNGIPMVLADKRVTSDFPVSNSAALVNVTGLSVSVQATITYGFSATLFCTDAAAGGVQAAIAGTCTATNIMYQGYIVDSAAIVANTQATALATAVANSVTTGTTPLVKVEGTITVANAGTLTVQFAQSSSNGTASTVKRGSFFRVWQMT